MPKQFDELVKDLGSWWPPRAIAAAEELACSGDRQAIGPLVGALALATARKRRAMVKALAALAGPEDVPDLLPAMALADVSARDPLVLLLGELLGRTESVSGPILALHNRLLPSGLLECAAAALVRLGHPTLPALMAALRIHKGLGILYWARKAMQEAHALPDSYPGAVGILAEDAAIPTLVRGLRDSRGSLLTGPSARHQVVEGWVQAAPGTVEPLLRYLALPDRTTRLWAAEALGRIGERHAPAGHTGICDRLRPLLRSPDAEQALCAAVVLGSMGERDAVPRLTAALGSSDLDTRLAGATALCLAGEAGAEALPALQKRRERDGDSEVRGLCEQAVHRITAALRHVPAELEAAPPPEGRGVELEAAAPPAGRGTEPEASAPPAGRDTELHGL